MSTYAPGLAYRIVPFTLTIPVALLLTASLFLLMVRLIATDAVPVVEKGTRVAEIVRVEPDPPEIIKNDPPEEIENPAPPPAWVSPELDIGPQDGEIEWAGGKFELPVNDDIRIGQGGGNIVAYLKTQPVYPTRLLNRGVEGYVDLAFDITPTGATTNIRVIESQPPEVFDRAAITALRKWKYKVPIVEGEPQGQVDMMTRMRFELEK
ncbi:energy transducer TonB [Mangrovimicrobium sediminis]|uniref:Protein TonB n=1 Tax=Mangrovimicrobium sediminis TaxID=2562682 RepID=A0A4Z0LYG3_9GAMM|nr:energy transducer TonB [Haliea sp. SAOS-164]TGD72125.1 energy transducer TonB [Haliea sp. SAOS-164]